MRKTILILILCAPLIWLTCREGLRLRDVSEWSLSNSKPTDGDDHPEAADMEKAKKAPPRSSTAGRCDGHDHPARPSISEGSPRTALKAPWSRMRRSATRQAARR